MSTPLTQEGPWRRTVLVSAVAIFLTFVGFGFMTPFIPLYLQEMGMEDAGQVRAWSGAITAAAALSFAVSAPFWGILADRLGRRPMVVRAMWSSGIALIAMSLVRDPALLLAVRLAQGVFSGPVTAAVAMVSTTVPERNLTRSIGSIQASMLIGGSVGPLLGGIIADVFGIPPAFVIGGCLNLLAGTLVLLLARERFTRPVQRARTPRQAITAWTSAFSAALLVLAAIQISMQFSSNGIVSVFALYVQELGRSVSAGTFTGLIQGLYSASAALGVLAAARIAGWFGYRRSLLVAVAAAGLLFVPQALAPDLLVLGVARSAQGFFTGLVSPLVATLVSAFTPAERRGSVYGAMSGFSGLGGAIGPLLAGFIAAGIGLPAVFWTWAGLLLAVALFLWFRLEAVSKPDAPAG